LIYNLVIFKFSFEHTFVKLQVVGVGDESATPLAATLTWLMRHGAGMIGQITFTWAQGIFV
jgi:hypothetical protein